MNYTMQDAIALRDAGQAEEAKALLLELLAEDADSAELYYQLAWTHDVLGQERAAVPYYEQSLVQGLPGEQRAGALLGLGSTYRTLGEYARSRAVLERGMAEFPGNKEFPAFLAMTLYNLEAHSEAVGILLKLLAETSADPGIRGYRKAISFYSDKLDQVWP